jgi:NADH dehydrogenase
LVRSPNSGELVGGRLTAAQRGALETRVGDVTRPTTLPAALAGVDAVLHLVAIPRDLHNGRDLHLVNTEGTRNVLAAMGEAGVQRLVHMGAMGVEDDLDWTILKPSLQFGPGDGFFNIVADLVRMSPGVVPVPGRGDARFQPIHVGDVARVIVASFADPTTIGSSLELGGPRYWSYREITQEVLRAMGRRRLIIPMPVPLIRLVAGTAERLRISFPVATDQLRQLRLDNIGPLDLIPERFGFTPRDLAGELGYLRRKARDQRVGTEA